MTPSLRTSARSQIGEESRKTNDIAARHQYVKIHCHCGLRRVGFVEENTRANCGDMTGQFKG